jgi:trehalose-6-phosphatase
MVTDLRNDWAEVTRRMRTAKALGVVISLDDAFFGPASSHFPSAVSHEGCQRIRSIVALERVTVALHSRERLSDLVAGMDVSGVWYVANRGFEIKDPQGRETQFFGPEDVRLLEKVQQELLLQTSHVAGVRLVHRGPCLALKYDEVDPPQVPIVLDIFRNIVGAYSPQVVAVHGHRSIEARIRTAFDEKTALRYVHRRLVPGTLFFYFGSDRSLLEMFGEFRPFAVLVEVGDGRISKYFLPGPLEVIEVLQMIVSAWEPARE